MDTKRKTTPAASASVASRNFLMTQPPLLAVMQGGEYKPRFQVDSRLEIDPETPFLATFVVASPLFRPQIFRKEAFPDRSLDHYRTSQHLTFRKRLLCQNSHPPRRIACSPLAGPEAAQSSPDARETDTSTAPSGRPAKRSHLRS